MPRLTRLAVVIWFSIVAAALPLAAKESDAEALLEQAISRYQAGQLQQSLALLRRVERLATKPATRVKVQLYLGFSSCVLGRHAQAEAAFTQALTLDPTLSLDPAETKKSIIELFDRVRSALRGELEVRADRPGARVSVDGGDKGPAPFKGQILIGRRKLVVATTDGLYRHSEMILIQVGRSHAVNAKLEAVGGRLQLTSDPAGATVLVDGKKLGKTPLRDVLLPQGSHRVELELAGHKTQVTSIQLQARQSASLALKLEPVAAAIAGPQPPAAGGRTGRRLRWTWVAAGTAVAAAGAGLGLGLWAKSGSDAYQRAADTGNLDDYKRLHDQVPGRALAANICFGVAGAAAVTAVVLFFFVETPEKPPAAAKAVSGLLQGWRF